MSITTSEIFRSVALGGGAFSITERHTDSTGKVHEMCYIAGNGTDTAMLLAVHAANLAISLAEAETDRVLS